MASNPMWYCFKCEQEYPAGQPCPRCGNGDYVRRATNYMVQSANAYKYMQKMMGEENHTKRAALMFNVPPVTVTPLQRGMAMELDRAIGLGNVEF